MVSASIKPFHWYICCGEGMADCCFGIQTWVIIIFGSLFMVCMFFALFRLNLLIFSFSKCQVLLAVLLFALWLGPPTKNEQRLKTAINTIADGAAPMIKPENGHHQLEASKFSLPPPMA
jgi:hypothetical protein